jgi:type 1 fimbriae regulatory protein FimB/type 1 fimbriae regulatory protein FimE
VPNAELRTREYLTEAEVERLIKAAKANRNGQRDATMILLAFRHGLRAAELVDLRWDQVDLGRNACLHVCRVKNGMPSVHPLQGDEMRALRELKRSADSPFVFVSERGTPFTKAGFAKMMARLGVEAGFKFGVHPHMLRHACGYRLQTGVMIPGRCRPTSATKIFSTRCDIRNCRRRGSKTFGGSRTNVRFWE